MAKYGLPPGVLIQEVDSEMVLLDVDSGRYFELNTMGAEMLRCLQQSGDPEQALQQILSEYDVTRDELEKDFGELLGQLMQQGLVHKVVEN